MTITVPAARTTVSGWRNARALTLVEAERFARHPLFLTGLGLCGLTTALTVRNRAPDMVTGFLPAVFIGVFSMLVAYRLTRSTGASAEAVDAAPTPPTIRTAALCLACLVPTAAGAAWLALFSTALSVRPPARWAYGTFGTADVLAMLASQSVIACLGASLLGVAAGRRLRFPAAAPVLVIAVVGWAILAPQPTFNDSTARLSTALRLFSPFAFFQSVGPGNAYMESYPGSPIWYVGWLLALCGLAVVAALLPELGRVGPRRLVTAGAGCLLLGVTCYLLAVSGGLDAPVRVAPDGSRTIVTAR